MLTRTQQLMIIGAIIFVCLIPFWLVNSSAQDEIFIGADEQAEGIVAKIAPDYEPWFRPFFEPPSAEIESLLFALQAALGAGVLGYYLGSKRKTSKDESKC
ncbi:MAG: energy-coupling factor ABC transporter substrate-binding protein [Firmicutes bacterium]|nr:energy-coupling factor ABC transporter substrate-binding protein [Bacillota bacterium]